MNTGLLYFHLAQLRVERLAAGLLSLESQFGRSCCNLWDMEWSNARAVATRSRSPHIPSRVISQLAAHCQFGSGGTGFAMAALRGMPVPVIEG